MEESSSQHVTGTDQERGREEEDGEKDEGGGKWQQQEEKHKDLQRDPGGEVRMILWPFVVVYVALNMRKTI